MTLKSPREIAIMAEGGRKLAAVLRVLEAQASIGMTTKELDRIAHDEILSLGAKPAFLNYRPAGARTAYPYTLCASLNDVVVHGQPSGHVIADGDIVSLDLGLIHKGYYLDAAITVGFGSVSRQAQKLITATKESLMAGIHEARIGKTMGDIGHAIAAVVAKHRFSVADNLIGHGIGKALHEDPPVFNFGDRGQGEELIEGMVLAIEPMVCAGSGAVKLLKDESFATRDGSLAAHFEHTVAITKEGPRILTR